MSRKSRASGDRIKGQFIYLFHETLRSPAYKRLSYGARALFTALRMKFSLSNNNNGRLFLCQRDVEKELGHKGGRNDVANWFRELQHYGFIVQTEGASLGTDGKGKAPRWRITDLPTRSASNQFNEPTKDFLHWDGVLFERHVRPSRRMDGRKQADLKKQNPGRHVPTTVEGTCLPSAVGVCLPDYDEVGRHVPPISVHRGGRHAPPISRSTTGWRAGSGLAKTTDASGPHLAPDEDDEEDWEIIINEDGNEVRIPRSEVEQYGGL
jgi:hypothetical protein